MTAIEASQLANRYRATGDVKILQTLRENGWKRLAELLESE